MAFVVNPNTQITDVLRIVEYPYRGASPVTILNLHDEITYSLVGGTFKITPPARKQQFAESSHRYGGGKLAQESHDNGQISAEWYITGTTAELAMANVEAFLTEIEEVDDRSPRYLAWQPAGAPRPVLYRIVGPAAWEPQYRWVEFKQNRTVHLAAGLIVAPLAEGLPMFINDRFDVNSAADYTTDVGSASDWAISNGSLHQAANFNTDIDVVHTDRNYMFGDHEGTIKFTLGTIVTNTRVGVNLKRKDSQNKLRVYFYQTGAPLATIRIASVIGGTETVLTSVNLPSTYTTGDVLYVRGWIEKNRIYGVCWYPGNAPEDTPSIGVAHTLSSGNSAIFGAGQYGQSGIFMRGQDATLLVDDFSNRPYHYKGGATAVNQTTPASIPLDGPVPGSAPAKAEVDVLLTSSAVAAPFALLSWVPEFPPFNFVWNGDFEDDTDGWAVAASPAVNPLHGAGTSITRITTDKYRGVASAQVNLPATNNTGAHFRMYRDFRRGVTYTVKLRVKATSGSPSVQMGVGNDSTTFGGSGATTINSTGWTELTATWLPTADYTSAAVFIRSETATAMNLMIDCVRVYIGATESTVISQSDGRGGAPPFGIIKALSRDVSRSTGWSASAETDTYLTANNYVSGALEFVVDPTLLPADPFASGETSVEAWMRISVNSGPVLITPKALSNTSIPAGARTTAEFGDAGKRVEAAGSGGTDWRTIRLGTLNFAPIHGDAARWRLRFGFKSLDSNNLADVKVEEIYLTPTESRALTPTGKPYDAAYPNFINATDGQKRISHDLRGSSTSLPSTGFFPDSGLGGEFIEFKPGNNRLFIKLADRIPDDPSDFVAAETSPINARIYIDVTPRYFLGRG